MKERSVYGLCLSAHRVAAIVAEAAAARALAQLGCSGGDLGIGGEPTNTNSVRTPDVQEDASEQREEERLPASSARKNAPTAAVTTA